MATWLGTKRSVITTFREHSVTLGVMIAHTVSVFGFHPQTYGETTVSVEKAIEKALSPFLTTPNRRDQQERIIVTDGRAEIWRYESFESGDLEMKICDSVRSLLLGRLSSSTGIKNLFSAQTQLRDLSLIHFRNQTSVQPDLIGRYIQSHKRLVLARMTITRESALSIDRERVNRILQGPRCVDEAKRLINDLWISESILERREALRVASIKMGAKKKPLVKRILPRSSVEQQPVD